MTLLSDLEAEIFQLKNQYIIMVTHNRNLLGEVARLREVLSAVDVDYTCCCGCQPPEADRRICGLCLARAALAGKDGP